MPQSSSRFDKRLSGRIPPGHEFENHFQLRYKSRVTLDQAPLCEPVVVQDVGGERAFRRRIMELGLIPGTVARVLRVAPLGDPIEIESRGSNLSIRRTEASHILVAPKPAQTRTEQ